MTKEELKAIKKVLSMPFAGRENLSQAQISTYNSTDYKSDTISKMSGFSSFYNFLPDGIPYVLPPDNPDNPPRASGLISRQYFNSIFKDITSQQFYEQCGGFVNEREHRGSTSTFTLSWYPKDAIVPVVIDGVYYLLRSKKDDNQVDFRTISLSALLNKTNDFWEACLAINQPDVPTLIDHGNSDATVLATFNKDFKVTVYDNNSYTRISGGKFTADGNVITESVNVLADVATTTSSVGFINVYMVIGEDESVLNLRPSPVPSVNRASSIQIFTVNKNPFLTGFFGATPAIPVMKDYYWSMWRYSEHFIGSNNPIVYQGDIKVKFTPNGN